ncbi:hypothetical protein QTL97_14800 [Sporosarcina thermotolerans]|uniref:DUF3888 domain-containing protein n=1 Tax=Sporosarcina thermotolerans TaxID=633404 RepID=A0AAW9AAZ0_9BACL|nr:DUF3888 domain-containing protein [Sporosarcina thermotolerans]MDW0118199.1 hypothetical protein [Sporosarcina thermotolerans]WHT47680.1 hypothetical protein QNH10_16345 [Sporosarcina thermotolerans]
MNKTMLPAIILTFLLLSFGGTPKATADTEIIPQDQFPSLLEGAFLRSLGWTILDIMEAHGDTQLFENERIEKISQNNGQYDVTLRVIGFEGAHSPPYKLIRMTIRFPGNGGNANYSVISYSHRIISDKEFEELTKNAMK